jgi:hypothetical protein
MLPQEFSVNQKIEFTAQQWDVDGKTVFEVTV